MFVPDYGYWHLLVNLAIVTLFDVKVQNGNWIIFLFSTFFALHFFGCDTLRDSGVSEI